MATTLTHLFMHVTDLDASRRFYVDDLGLEVLMEHPGYLRVGREPGFFIGMEERDPAGGAGIQLTVQVDDVHTTYERLRGQGTVFDGPPEPQAWGATHAWLCDPTGYRVSIYS